MLSVVNKGISMGANHIATTNNVTPHIARQGDALITLVLTNVQPEDVIEVHALGGCFLNVSSEQQL